MKKKKLYIILALGLSIIGMILWPNADTATKTIATNSTTNDQELLAISHEPTLTVQLKDAHGNPVHFSDFEGKVVFINNWATWCRPCTMEMPTIQKLKEHFKKEKLAFVMISYDRNPETSIQWMKDQGYTLPVYSRGKDLPRKFMTRGIPATFVLNKKGEMVYRHVGMSNYNSANFISQMEKWLEE